MIEAQEILCSENPSGDRLMTMLATYPKFVHNEHLRHRAFSFSVNSSRAIPVANNLEEVRSDALRAAPVWWGRKQKGMQSGDELSNEDMFDDSGLTYKQFGQMLWRNAALDAVERALGLYRIGVHKSIINRILEPFLHAYVLVSGTTNGWMNFFGLRLDKAAQPEIRALAEVQWKVWNESKPLKLQPGDWHVPFVDPDDDYPLIYAREACEILSREPNDFWSLAIRTSVARCARLSYLSFTTKKRSTIEEDLRLYDKLVGSSPIHASPAEHQATPDVQVCECSPDPIIKPCIDDSRCPIRWGNYHQAGNFGLGWIQYRKMLPDEAVAPLPTEYQQCPD